MAAPPGNGNSQSHEEVAGAVGGTEATDQEEAQQDERSMAFLKQFLDQLHMVNHAQGGQLDREDKPKPEQFLKEVSFQGIADFMQDPRCKNIIVLCGAGISTAAGIPDFRSPGTGLYHNLQKYDLPHPQAIFQLDYFREQPGAFFTLAKELYPGEFKPTTGHYFVRLLEQKGLLQRVYTQNIDTLERVAKINGEKIVEAHGTFYTAHCIDCRKQYSQEWIRDIIFQDKIPRCIESDCSGIVKPDIVFFGESLPAIFHQRRTEDFGKCDLLIVMGTSLKVQPFASLVDCVPDTTPRLLINREKSGDADFLMMLFGRGMKFDDEDNYRDVFWEGNCDDGCRALCSLLGWLPELDAMVEEEHKKIDEAKSKM